MALTQCKECGAKISSSAKACPQCGAPPPKRTSKFTWVVAVVMVLFLVSYVKTVADRGNRTPAQEKADAAANEAPLRQAAVKRACQEAVSDRLKAPASADFVDPVELLINRKDDHEYFVHGFVDAQNSFGAKIRNEYRCSVKAGDKWSENTVTKVAAAAK